MKGITVTIKLKIIKLFLTGSSYDEISMEVGVAKGTVVNVINEFRDGELSVPPGTTEYVDELRKVAVDMKKYSTTIGQLKGYTKLHVKIKEMEVPADQIEQWLDISQQIATGDVSNSEFVSSALELAKLAADTGKNYKDVIADYKEKLQAIKELDEQAKLQKEQLVNIEKKAAEEKEQATKELDAITKAIETAQKTFSEQKKEIKQQLDEYMAQSKLSWDTVKVVVAILDSKLSDTGLDDEQKAVTAKEVSKVGSLTICIKNLEHKQKIMTEKVSELEQQEKSLSALINGQKSIKNELASHLLKETKHRSELDAEIKVKSEELAVLKEVVSEYGRDLYAAWLILGFLTNPELLNNYDFDKFVQFIVGIRQYRLGVGPKIVTSADGKVVCQCLVPALNIPESDYSASLEEAREQLALYLVPAVKEKFVPKLDYDLQQLSKTTVELYGETLDLIVKCAGLSGRSNTSK